MATPNLTTYTTSGVVFAKANANNLAIAKTPKGIGTLTDVITPISFASGTITVTNGSTGVSGISTAFNTELNVGQYLFYYNSNGDPVLAGKIATISSATSLTLATQFPGSTVSGKNCGVTDVVAGGFDDFIVQIPTQINIPTKQCIIPNWAQYVIRVSPGVIGENNPNNISLEQYSNVNNPQVAATPPLTSIPFVLTPIGADWPWNKGTRSERAYFPNTESFPSFCYAKLNPYGDTDSPLPSNTLYKYFINQNFNLNGLIATVNLEDTILTQQGYILL